MLCRLSLLGPIQVPSGAVVVRGGAYITALVARAGVVLEGTIMHMYLSPILSLAVGPSGKITACLDASIELHPLQTKLEARIGYLKCVEWEEVRTGWGPWGLERQGSRRPHSCPKCAESSRCGNR